MPIETTKKKRREDVEVSDKLTESLERQLYEYPLYREFFQEFGSIEPKDIRKAIENGETHRIPPIPASYFKKSFGVFPQLSKLEKNGRWNVSSSTGGDPSYVYRTPNDEKVMKESYLTAFRAFPPTDVSIVFSPPESFLKRASQRFSLDDGKEAILQVALIHEASRDYYGEIHYAATPKYLEMLIRKLLHTLRGPVLKKMSRREFRKIIEDAHEEGKTLGFGASVILLYPMVMEYVNPGEFNFENRMYVTTGAGGWKGKKGTLQGNPIDKKDYIENLCERFGISSDQIMDVYAFTENFAAYRGLWDDDIGDFVFEVPGGVKVYAMSEQGKIAKPGEDGIFIVYSADGHEGFAGAAIEQNDIVRVIEVYEDGSLRKFTNIRRRGSESRGCAYEMSSGVR